MRRWLQSLLVLWLLLGVSVPVWAACTSPQTATIPSGGSVVFGCADTLGFDNPAITPPSHGSLDWGDSDSVYNLIYTNNGDGATSDTFVAMDEDTFAVITFNITVEPATSLVVSPAVLPTPTIGVAYSVQMSTSGGDAPYSYSLGAGGEFPPGLSLSTSGLVSGTPTQSGTHSFTVNVSDASAVTASRSYSVNIPAPALDMSPDSAVTGFETVAYNLVLSGSGGTSPYVFTVDGGLGPLPPGLSLDTSGAITGTPAAGSAGSYPVRIVMADQTTKSTSADTHSMAQDFTFVIQSAPTIAVGPTALTGATVGAAYSQALSASGGSAPYAFAVTSGSLPAGLSLAADGSLTGTPTAGGNFNFTVTATDSNGFSGDRAYNPTVAAAVIALSPGLASTNVGVTYAGSITASGGTAPYSYAITAGALPPGLTLDAATGAITGTATAASSGPGDFAFTVAATDDSTGSGPYTGSLDYVLVVYAAIITVNPATLPDGLVGAAYSQAIAASGGTAPYRYELNPGSTLPAGVSLSSDGVLSGTPTAAGTFNFIIDVTDSSGGGGGVGPFTQQQPYDLTIASAVPVAGDVSATVAYGSGANPITLDISGGTPTSVAVASPASHGTAIASGTSITYQPTAGYAGPDSFTYTATNLDGISAPATVSITVSPPTIVITPSAPLTAQVGTPYSQTFTWSGGAAPYTGYSVTGLPAGLAVTASDTDSVTVSGTPTEGGSFTLSVSASDSSSGSGPFTAGDDFTLVVDASSLSMTPAAGALPDATYPQAWSQSFVASSGTAPYSYALTGAVPAGLSFDASTGVLSGAAGQRGTYNFTITATDSSTGPGAPYQVAHSYALTVLADIDPGPLADGAAAVAYSQTVTATGGAAPYTFAMNIGTSLPPGLSLAADGTVSGTPTASGTYLFNIRATDINGVMGARGYNMTIAPATLVITPSTLPDGMVDTAYSQTIGATGGIAPYSYAVTAGALPPGLTLSAAGILAGSATSSGTYNFDVQASDSSGGTPATETISYTLVIEVPTITLAPAALPDGAVFNAYSQMFTASGGSAPYAFSVTGGSLPAGMSLASDGTLSGTPTVVGASTFTVTATDSGSYSGTGNYTLSIVDVAPTANAVSATVAHGSGATPITLDISGSTATSVSVASAAAHGSASASGLSISYEPAAGFAGTDSFTYIASNAAGDSAPATVSITVSAPTLALTPAAGTLAPDYGAAYSQVFSASGGAAPYTYVLTGALPAGLVFDTASGTLSGTATEPGSFPITVTATDSSTGAAAPFAVAANYDVQVAAATIVIAPAALADGTVDSAYSQALTASGGIAPYTFAVVAGTLPAGLQLAADGTLSGTPVASGTFAVTLQATDAHGQAGDGDYTLVIGQAPPTANDVSATVAYGSGATPVALDITGGVPTSVSVASAPAHGSASASGLSISYEPAAGFAGVDSFTYIASNAAGDSAPATVSITVSAPTLALTPAAGTLAPDYGVAYSQVFSASGGAAPYTYALTGTLPAGLVFDTASGTLSGMATESGSFPVTVTATDSSTGPAAPFSVGVDYDVEVASAAIVVTPATLADGTAGSVYSQGLAASGGIGPYTFAITSGSLPAGLQLAGDGTLSGTPTASGTFDTTVTATDANGQATEHAYTLTVAVATLSVTPAAVPAGTVGVAYSQAFSTSGGVAPYSHALGGGALPPGMAISADGVLSGTPTASGSFAFDLQVTDGSGGTAATETASYVLVVNAPIITLTPAALPDGTVGAAYSQAFTASGGTAAYVFSVTAGSLPDGLHLAGDGSLSGTPTAEGEFSFTVEARDANDQPGSRDYTLAVAGVVPVAAAHHAQLLAGSSVEVELTEGATGGPFTGAEALAIAPVEAGSASVARVGDGDDAGYLLTFTAESDYAGTATVRYTLSNATATSAPATVTIEIAARPDPTLDAEVTGLLRAQVQSVRRLAEGQIGNFQGRLERLHGGRGGANGFDNGLTVMADRPCAEDDWQVVGSVCQRPLGDEQAPGQAPSERAAARSSSSGQAASASRFAIWTAGAMRFGDYDPRRGASGFEFETSGLSVGADYRFGPAFALGAGFGYGRDVSDIGEHDSRSEADAWSAAIYASYHPGEHVYLDGLLGYQQLSLDLRRHVTANEATVTGDRDGSQWFVSLAAGYEWQREQLRLTPYARIDHASAELDGYVEHGDPLYALAFEQQDIDTTTTSLGLRVDYVNERDWGTFAPQLRLEYQHDLDADSVATMRYADLPLGPWYSTGVDGFDRNRFELGLGAAWQTQRQFGLRLEYLHRLGNSGVDDQSLRLQLEKKF